MRAVEDPKQKCTGVHAQRGSSLHAKRGTLPALASELGELRLRLLRRRGRGLAHEAAPGHVGRAGVAEQGLKLHASEVRHHPVCATWTRATS